MVTPANAVRFFGIFNFMTLTKTGQSMCYPMHVRALRSGPFRGTGFAYRLIMPDQPERMNAQEDGLPVIPAVDFKAEVLDSKEPVLVEFWAPWSRSCQVVDSVLQEVASACAGKVKVVKVNADDNLDLSLWYDIQSIPTLLYFIRGNPCLRIVGTATKQAILAKLRSLSD